MNELRLNIHEYNITLHLLVGIWLVRMTLHKTCKGTFFHDHMMRCPVDMLMLLWPLKSTFLIENSTIYAKNAASELAFKV